MGVVATETELLRPTPPPSDAHPHRPQYSSGPVGYTTLCIYVAAHRLFGSVKKKYESQAHLILDTKHNFLDF